MHADQTRTGGRFEPSAAVAVNARSLARRMTGVERYAHEVTRRIGPRVRLVRAGNGASGLNGHLWEQFHLPRRLKPGELLWSPANTGPLWVSRQVVTIHDLSPFDFPQGLNPRFRAWYRLLLPILARRARRVIADSVYSRSRVIERLGVPPGKVIVIPCGVDQAHFSPRPASEVAAVRRRYRLPSRYMLAVGSLAARKNLGRLLCAWERSGLGHDGIGLVVAGGRGGAFLPPRLDRRLDGVRWPGYVPDRDLPALYSGALAFVMPSLYEGFGLPVLEAMACGAPVIAGQRAALPEVVGEAGWLVNPRDVEALSAALYRAVGDPHWRTEFSKRGLVRAEAFPWERTAKEVWEVLEQVSGEESAP